MKLLRHFWIDVVFLLAALVVATVYGGAAALELTAILVVVEIVFSFDNATVNARILERMNLFWRKVFLTVGVLIAVFGMRLVFPLVIVSLTARISPWRAVELAWDKGDVHQERTYGYLLAQAHPSIAAFGGMFLLLLALDFLLDDDREVMWLAFIERHLKKAGRLQQLPVVIAGIVLAVISTTLTSGPESRRVLFAGLVGIIAYVLIKSLGELIGPPDPDREPATDGSGPAGVVGVSGRAALGLFLYLEVIDASFSFDGVLGAFAITPDPIIIALGLGVGALFIRSLTTYLVAEKTLHRYEYLEHGAHWAIITLAVILLVSVKYTIPDVVTGMIGVILLAAAFLTSVAVNRRTRT